MQTFTNVLRPRPNASNARNTNTRPQAVDGNAACKPFLPGRRSLEAVLAAFEVSHVDRTGLLFACLVGTCVAASGCGSSSTTVGNFSGCHSLVSMVEFSSPNSGPWTPRGIPGQ